MLTKLIGMRHVSCVGAVRENAPVTHHSLRDMVSKVSWNDGTQTHVYLDTKDCNSYVLSHNSFFHEIFEDTIHVVFRSIGCCHRFRFKNHVCS